MSLHWQVSREPPAPGGRQLVHVEHRGQETFVREVVVFDEATHQVTCVSGRPFVTHLSEHDAVIAKTLQEQGVWEPAESMILAGLVYPGTVVLDIGANIGYYTVSLAHWLGMAGAVFAFEPEPRNFEILRLNATLAGLSDPPVAPIHLLPFAVADHDGQATLNVSHWNLGLHSLVESPPEAVGSLQVPTITLDTLRFGSTSRTAIVQQRVNLIKSDAQGAELLILRGGERLIAEDRPVLCLEFEPSRGLAPCLELTYSLEQHGYRDARLFYADNKSASQTLSELSCSLPWGTIRRLAQAGAFNAYCTLIAYPPRTP